jgi:ribose 5-phosphate isomerase B
VKLIAGADHAGFALKNALVEQLRSAGHEVTDIGTFSSDRVDYPDFGSAVARGVVSGEHELGLAVCGSGIGIAIAAAKVPGGRPATCHDVTSAQLARAHNDANVLCIGERLIGPEVARAMLAAFIATPFEGGRHQGRVAKLTALDEPSSH